MCEREKNQSKQAREKKIQKSEKQSKKKCLCLDKEKKKRKTENITETCSKSNFNWHQRQSINSYKNRKGKLQKYRKKINIYVRNKCNRCVYFYTLLLPSHLVLNCLCIGRIFQFYFGEEKKRVRMRCRRLLNTQIHMWFLYSEIIEIFFCLMKSAFLTSLELTWRSEIIVIQTKLFYCLKLVGSRKIM